MKYLAYTIYLLLCTAFIVLMTDWFGFIGMIVSIFILFCIAAGLLVLIVRGIK